MKKIIRGVYPTSTKPKLIFSCLCGYDFTTDEADYETKDGLWYSAICPLCNSRVYKYITRPKEVD